ncbi:MAG TPA: OpgC domain-containing protein [Stellaceae bacterium]|nr:OpgC domain-containing protein [Stellaceae bacterium]
MLDLDFGATVAQASANRARDPRLDFFRGSAMFIIFIAHCRGNSLWNCIPARFGVSGAAVVFMFPSGMSDEAISSTMRLGDCFAARAMTVGVEPPPWT